MLENQIVQKSSEISGDHSGPEFVQESTKIYFDPQQAIADFDADVPEVKEERITDPRVANFIRHAQVLMKHREYPLAMNLLREASNKDSKNPATLNMLANCLDKMSRSSEALIVRKTLAQVDYGFESLHGYATSLYKSGRDQEALDKYFEALAVLTDETDTLFETYKNMGNIDIPIIVRLQGTNAEEAKKLIDESGLKVQSAIQLSEAAELVNKAGA